MTDTSRYDGLSFEHFRAMAQDPALSRFEKVGFPDDYRQDQEAAIFADIAGKLPALARPASTIVDIGSGCSDLPRFFIEQAVRQHQQLILIDSAEMLTHLPDTLGVTKLAARFPHCDALLTSHAGRVDAINVYSVIQYVFAEANLFEFVDKALSLLAPQGRLLIGDIPNNSKRKRLFASETGREYHRQYALQHGGDPEAPPEPAYNRIEHATIDDSIVLALLARARLAGFDAYVLPQHPDLPMANRREDILIVRP
ncbi:hypothetical protein QU487_07800 [Crenobacter sp. SG2305]|uniref:hypothetical protein n=1 Tax=Crenobacter oryzisoli TaxID=3056844 RepID=UPI0025AA8135|nr:hypothetical protein [Crenobacter sp. SG2305]MDN0082651.1 hypothetical protein [Crenobacter sp. SG2305]